MSLPSATKVRCAVESAWVYQLRHRQGFQWSWPRHHLADLHSRDRAGFVLHICAQPNGLTNEGLIRGHHFRLPLAPLLARARAPSLSRLGVEELERVREERPRDKRPHTP